MEIEHLSIVNVLVIAHTVFSISLLGVGSPYMGHYSQVQVACHLQGYSLRGERQADFCCLVSFGVLHVYSSQGLNV